MEKDLIEDGAKNAAAVKNEQPEVRGTEPTEPSVGTAKAAQSPGLTMEEKEQQAIKILGLAQKAWDDEGGKT
jgi:hypothetical protein